MADSMTVGRGGAAGPGARHGGPGARSFPTKTARLAPIPFRVFPDSTPRSGGLFLLLLVAA